MSFPDDIGARLVAAGVGALGTSIFLSAAAKIPTGAGPYLTVIETGGMAPTRKQNITTPSTLRPTAQIAVRASTYVAARTMAQAAYDNLDGVYNTAINGKTYLRIVARQEVTDAGIDDVGRPQVVFNIEAERQP